MCQQGAVRCMSQVLISACLSVLISVFACSFPFTDWESKVLIDSCARDTELLG